MQQTFDYSIPAWKWSSSLHRCNYYQQIQHHAPTAHLNEWREILEQEIRCFVINHRSALLLQQLKHQKVKSWSFWKGWSRRCNDIPLSSEQPSILYIPGIKQQPASTRIHPPPPSCSAPPPRWLFPASNWLMRRGKRLMASGWVLRMETLTSYASVLSRKRPAKWQRTRW